MRESLRCNRFWCFALAVLVSLALSAAAQDGARQQGMATSGAPPAATARPTPDWVVPTHSIERPEDAGLRAHTNIVFRSLDGTNKPTRVQSPQAAPVAPPSTVQYVESPSSLGCLYVKSPATSGCVPNLSANSGGPSAAGWGAIALVDAYDNPDAASDLATFDSYWGLPAASFVKVYANGNGDCTTPPPDAGWSTESSLDIEYAHMYAPNAVIILVEACSSFNTDLFYAEQVAMDWVASYGGGQVSNSWGEGEFSGQTGYDALFAGFDYGFYTQPIVTFVSAGDSGCGAAYPSSDPWVVSAGGSGIYRSSTTGGFLNEQCWGGSGGGVSSQETYTTSFSGGNTGPWADYQYPIFAQSNRATPDLSSNSDPNSGVYIYSLYGQGGWSCCWGGTSEASPSLAGIINRANNRLSTCFFNGVNNTCWFTNGENNLLYAQLPTKAAYKANFYDVVKGTNGCTVAKGWDYCTGVGTPRGLLGK